MSKNAVKVLFLAVALLVSQTFGVAAHCIALTGEAGHEHSAGGSVGHNHGISAALHNHETVDQHAHSKSGDPIQDYDIDLLASHCSFGCVGIGLDVATAAHPFDSGETLDPRPQPVPGTEIIDLLTPPPNTIL